MPTPTQKPTPKPASKTTPKTTLKSTPKSTPKTTPKSTSPAPHVAPKSTQKPTRQDTSSSRHHQSTHQDDPNPKHHQSLLERFGSVDEAVSTANRKYMLAARPLLWLSSLALCALSLSLTCECLYVVWWATGSEVSRRLLGFGLRTLIIGIIGGVLDILGSPRGDYLHGWRIIGSLALLGGGFILGIVKGWLPAPDVIINSWFASRESFSWLPFCTVSCGAVWVGCNFFSLIVKLYFWSDAPTDLES